MPFLALGWAGVAINLMQRNKAKKLTVYEVIAAMFIGGVFALLAGKLGEKVGMAKEFVYLLVFLVSGNAERLARIAFSKGAAIGIISFFFPKFGEFLEKEKDKEKEDK